MKLLRVVFMIFLVLTMAACFPQSEDTPLPPVSNNEPVLSISTSVDNTEDVDPQMKSLINAGESLSYQLENSGYVRAYLYDDNSFIAEIDCNVHYLTMLKWADVYPEHLIADFAGKDAQSIQAVNTPVDALGDGYTVMLSANQVYDHGLSGPSYFKEGTCYTGIGMLPFGDIMRRYETYNHVDLTPNPEVPLDSGNGL